MEGIYERSTWAEAELRWTISETSGHRIAHEVVVDLWHALNAGCDALAIRRLLNTRVSDSTSLDITSTNIADLWEQRSNLRNKLVSLHRVRKVTGCLDNVTGIQAINKGIK